MLKKQKHRADDKNGDDKCGFEIFHGTFRLRAAQTKITRKIRFDMAAELRQLACELTAKFPLPC
jgi:hypothetical protein